MLNRTGRQPLLGTLLVLAAITAITAVAAVAQGEEPADRPAPVHTDPVALVPALKP